MRPTRVAALLLAVGLALLPAGLVVSVQLAVRGRSGASTGDRELVAPMPDTDRAP
jgi:hypothetical protein